MNSATKTPPLIILGMDVGDDTYIKKWAGEGHLPNLATLMKNGGYGTTSGNEFICEYGLVSSLFSGISRVDHGCYYFRQLKPKTYDLINVKADEFDIPPFWSHLKKSGKKVLTVDVPEIGIVKGLTGLQLANWTTLHGADKPAITEPTNLLPEVEQVFGDREAFRTNYNSSFEEDKRIYQRLLDRVKKKGKLCKHLYAKDDFDLSMFFFSEADVGGHQFWKYRPGSANKPDNQPNSLTNALRNIYQAIDQQIGDIISMAPKNASIVFLSLYGMQDEYPTSTLTESFCRQLGYQLSPNRDGQKTKKSFSLSPMNIARSIIPESWRITLSSYLPRSRREKILAENFKNNTDWSNTKAFSIPSYYTGFIQVNLKGREPSGIIEPGQAYIDLINQLEQDLKQLMDPVTGKPAVKKIGKTYELFNQTIPKKLPDIFVVWEPGPRLLKEVLHPKTTLVQTQPEFGLDNQEKLSGFMIINSPMFRDKGDQGTFDVLDLAPLFLKMLGQEIPATLSNKSIIQPLSNS